jgi:hypothetical protein
MRNCMASNALLHGCESWTTIHQNSNKKENRFAEIKFLSPLKSSQSSNIFDHVKIKEY